MQKLKKNGIKPSTRAFNLIPAHAENNKVDLKNRSLTSDTIYNCYKETVLMSQTTNFETSSGQQNEKPWMVLDSWHINKSINQNKLQYKDLIIYLEMGSFKKDVLLKSQFFHPCPPHVTLCHFP